MAQLKTGDQAPDFGLQDQNGKKVKLTDFKGRKLLLYFYPKANTSGWTTQAQSVRDAQAELTKRGVAVAGISPDDPAAQKKFDEKYHLRFPLLSDGDRSVAKIYGAWGAKMMYGKKTEGIIRSSFLIDEQGKIIQAWYKISPQDTIPKALATLAGWAFGTEAIFLVPLVLRIFYKNATIQTHVINLGLKIGAILNGNFPLDYPVP